MKYILAIDQGTSSTKTLIIDEYGKQVAKGVATLHTHYFDEVFVEQDPNAIYENVLTSVKDCLANFTSHGNKVEDIVSIGISNQRETFVVWDQEGRPLHNAVVWQCKRSVDICKVLKQQGHDPIVRHKTGLLIDPYFSATKLMWLNDHNENIRQAIQNGTAYFGTIDTWLLYKMTKGKVYATDHTNASRTLLFNLHNLQWDQELISLFGLNGIQLPSVHTSAYHYGTTYLEGIFNFEMPITALIGDSHAAAFGEHCFHKGTAKATMGTGSSILMNIGEAPIASKNGMVTTVCWSIPGRIDFAFEGVIVSCGATIEWLKNNLQLFEQSNQTAAMAQLVNDNGGVYLIPAFSGLGSPHWQMDRKASIVGMTFDTTKNHIVRAALESIPYQIKDVITAMEMDAQLQLKNLNIDGGITANTFLVQYLADVVNRPVAAIKNSDVSALGAALLAGLLTDVFDNIEAIANLKSDVNIFEPRDSNKAQASYLQWQNYVIES